MTSPEHDMAVYLQQHKVPNLIDEMIIGMEGERPTDVVAYMQKWLQQKQRADPSFGVAQSVPRPKLSEEEKRSLSAGLGGGMGLLRRTGTVMETNKVRDRTKGVRMVNSEIRHAAEIDISSNEDSMQGAKRMNGL